MEGERKTIKREKEFKLMDTRFIKDPEEFLNMKYEFRYNVITNKPEYRDLNLTDSDGSTFSEIDDYKLNSIYRDLNNFGLKCTEQKLKTLVSSDFCPKHNPFLEYLNNLPEWDGQTDYINELAETIKTNNNEFWKKCLKKWIVALVGSLYSDEVINDQAIVFSGRQGVGKTRWIKKLIPELLKSYWYSGTINPDNKDTFVYLAECMLINLDELENLQRKQIGSLKEVITKPNIRVRIPYDKYAKDLPHRASFIGSINQKQFLTDFTGSRRFLCFDVDSIDYEHKIDIDLVYSQALYLFKNEFRYWFDEEEILEIENNNDPFEVRSLEEEYLLQRFIPIAKGNAKYSLPTGEIVRILASDNAVHGKLNSIRMGKVLNKYGFERYKKGGIYVYALDDKQEGA